MPSWILPAKTHPTVGYDITELRDSGAIVTAFHECGRLAARLGIRTVFHPDQFVVLNSQRPAVVSSAIDELEYHAQIAEWVGADVINIHVGGAYGDKAKALDQFAKNVEQLSDAARSRLTIENDDTIFTPSDLLPLCRSTGLPLVYDVHHHRCLPDVLSVEAATELALTTWNREPLFHLSSPLAGWTGPRPRRHHDYIDVADFPDCWWNLALTVEVEAKAKELALQALLRDLQNFRVKIRGTHKLSDESLQTKRSCYVA
jgi:UV DNA damage endonuclease